MRKYIVRVGSTELPEMGEELAKRTMDSAKAQGLKASMRAVSLYRVTVGSTRMPAMGKELAERTAASARAQGLKVTMEVA